MRIRIRVVNGIYCLWQIQERLSAVDNVKFFLERTFTTIEAGFHVPMLWSGTLGERGTARSFASARVA